MFRNTVPVTVSEPAPEVAASADDLVPLSVLALDLNPPSVGGPAYLAAKGIEVLTDDLGRPAISRDDARMLITEKREAEAPCAGSSRTAGTAVN